MKKLIFSLLAFCLLLPGLALADGGLIPPDDYYIWETGQRGAIFYESDTTTETLVLSMNFQGNAKDFAWIIPTPNKPEVTKGNQELFTALEEKTGDYYYNDIGLGMAETAAAPAGDKVTVIEEKTIDYYDVAVLSATDPDALTKWLNNNGFKYPEKYSYIFNDYINNGWYFVAAKIQPKLAEDTNIQDELNYGTATPLQLTFQAKNIVFPLQISKISGGDAPTIMTDAQPIEAIEGEVATVANDVAEDIALMPPYPYEPPAYVDITLYIIAGHQQEVAGWTTEYADKIDGKEVQDLAVDTNGDPWVTAEQSNYYLTKLYTYMAYADMDNDIFPKDTEKDATVKGGYEWSGEDTTQLVMYTLVFIAIGIVIGIMSPFGLLFIIYTSIFFLTKNVKARIVFIVLQIIDTIVTFAFMALATVITVFAWIQMFDNVGSYYYLQDDIIASAAALAAAKVLGLLFIGKLIILCVERKKFKRDKGETKAKPKDKSKKKK
ncbi:DUF2330 domain-containing protein [Patescibacteria group bacterium]|nr:DUF2330 domain-containing protein [Patescibacteria group bacterium]MBU1673945.1 DUF2330 domain-containing protein [Patescibacteria group bacterium]MBU1963939.1 DUF2330 domain-containing protein [Patescibacteria group bacterium]